MDVYVSIINFIHKCDKCMDSGITTEYVGTNKIVAYKKALYEEWTQNYISHSGIDDCFDSVNEKVFITLLRNYNKEIKNESDYNVIFEYIINDPYFSLIINIENDDSMYGSVACNPMFLNKWKMERELKFYAKDPINYYKFVVDQRVLNDETHYEE